MESEIYCLYFQFGLSAKGPALITFDKSYLSFQGIPVDRQRIIFKGKVLHDEKLMKDYSE